MRGIERTPVDTTGAGDNFDAGFIAAVLDGQATSATGLALGCACGAISTGGLGGTGRLAGAEEAATLAAEVMQNNLNHLSSVAGHEDRSAPEQGVQLAARPDLEFR